MAAGSAGLNANPSVVYVVPDKMGGVMNIVASLLAHRRGPMPHHVILTDNRLSTDTRFSRPLPADTQQTLHYALPTENLHAVLARLSRAVPHGGGVLVTSDLLELAMLHRHDPGRMVVQVLHGDHDYYYDLAERHQAVVDVFVAYSRRMYETLQRRLPQRSSDVIHLPYGVPLPVRTRMAAPGPLRLIFAGRFEHGQKGVFDLPGIDRALSSAGVDVRWTLIGGGPDEPELRRRWQGAHLDWRGAVPHQEVLEALPGHDVFVLPTRAEGFPVALVEAMAAGVVPVVSDIPSGVPEVVDDGVTGMLAGVGDETAFARAIEMLARDRGRLDTMSVSARQKVAARFDARTRTADYETLYAGWRERRRPRPARLPLPYGSRLDHPWVPNAVVRAIRTVARTWQGKPA